MQPKITPLKKLQKSQEYTKAFQKLGIDWTVSADVYKHHETYTCLMYGYPLQKKLNEVSAMMLRKIIRPDEKLFMKSKNEFSRLSLILHVDRVNHNVALYKRVLLPNYKVPKPLMDKDG